MPNRLAVLVVDDDERVVRALASGLAGHGVDIGVCAEPAEALLVVGRSCPDAVLLGPVSGRLDPMDFLAVVRAADPQLPILVGVGAGSGDFAVRAASAGGSVVVPRPYRVAELVALLRSLTPARRALARRPPPIDLGRLRIDGVGPRITLDGKAITLPLKEFLLLRCFAEHEGEVLTRAELITAVWDGDTAHSNTLTVHIMRLRRRLGDTDTGAGSDAKWISSLRGVGYRFAVPDRVS